MGLTTPPRLKILLRNLKKLKPDRSPSTEANRQSFLRRPGPIRGCRANDDDEDETWSLTLREERRLRLFENRVLRRIFGPKRDEVTGEWRKLHKEEINPLAPEFSFKF